MSSTFTPIDLSTVPAPAIVETLDFNTIFGAMVADLQSRDDVFTSLVESDPAWKVLEVAAYRELLLRERINNASKAIMLPYATGADLDNLASFFGVTRNTITPANPTAIPPIDAVLESDSSLRYRTTLALDGLSTAGPFNSYLFHALSVPAVLDASVAGPMTDSSISPGNVVVTILGNHAADAVNVNVNGSLASGGVVIGLVSTALNNESVRPITDAVTVQGATIQTFSITASVKTFSGPDPTVVIANARASVSAYVATRQKLGTTVPLAGIYAALFVSGVENVTISSPSADVVCTYSQAPYCTGVTLTNGGLGT